tara:strand:+ start:56179 stop:56493 length:315 start_codon:yes stop_codon:yes gene_type:complete
MLCFITSLSACCTLECVGPVDRNIKPYLHYWEKLGVMAEQSRAEKRRVDSVSCGGSRSDTHPNSVNDHDETKLMLPGETIWETRERLSIAWVNCMVDKGYQYIP